MIAGVPSVALIMLIFVAVSVFMIAGIVGIRKDRDSYLQMKQYRISTIAQLGFTYNQKTDEFTKENVVISYSEVRNIEFSQLQEFIETKTTDANGKGVNANMTDLELKIKDAAQKYYQDGTSPYSDEEFDAMIDQLRQTIPSSELFRTGWGYKVEADPTPGDKFSHLYTPVGSLNKVRCWDEFPKEFRSGETYASIKLDGLSVALYYRFGLLTKALTRGDGYTGIDITSKVYNIDPDLVSIPDKKFTGCVRGEILMTHDNFKRFQKRHPDAKNPRNSAAGLISAKDETYADLDLVDIVVYTVIGDETHGAHQNYYNMSNITRWLYYNFNIPAPYGIFKLTEDNYQDELAAFKAKYDCIYPCDGIVLTRSQLEYNPETHRVAYPAIAFKFKAEEKITKVVDVIWTMSKTRFAIPRIQVEPITLAGTTVTYASGFNAKYIQDNNIGKGAVVSISKQGEIIPDIQRVLTPADHPDMLVNCPDCNTPLEWSGVHLCCPNTNCSNAETQDLLIWLNNIAPLDNFGNKLRLKFLTEYYGQDLTIEKVMSNHKTIVSSPIFGKQHELFVKMIHQAFNGTVTLKSALLALNIPRLGDVTSEKLAQYPDVVERIICAAEADDPMSILDLNGYIGDANADSIRDNLYKFKRLRFLNNRIQMTKVVASADKGNVAITGKLSVSRKQFEAELQAAGFKVVSSVNKYTDFLITDDPQSATSKNASADKFNVPKLSEQDFRSKYM